MNLWAYAEGAQIGATWDGNVASLGNHHDAPWIRLKTPELSDQAALAVRLGAFNDSSLVVTHATKYNEVALEAFLRMKCVSHLDLSASLLTNFQLTRNQNGNLARNSSITSLKTHALALSFATLEALGTNTTIVKLDTSGCAMHGTVTALEKTRTLRVLCMRLNTIDATGARALARIGSLEELDVSSNSIEDAGAEALLQHTSLKILLASLNKITSKGIKPIAHNTSISVLHLSKNRIGAMHHGSTDVQPFALNTTIKSLDLYDNHLTCKDMAVLAGNTTLTSLKMSHSTSHSPIDGIIEVMVALGNNTNIVDLGLGLENPYDTADIMPLCKNTTIRVLDLLTHGHHDCALIASNTTLCRLTIRLLTHREAEILARNDNLMGLCVETAEEGSLATLFRSKSLSVVRINNASVDLKTAIAIQANTSMVSLTFGSLLCTDPEACAVLAKCPSLMGYGRFVAAKHPLLPPGEEENTTELQILQCTTKNQKRQADLRGKFMGFSAIMFKILEIKRSNKRINAKH